MPSKHTSNKQTRCVTKKSTHQSCTHARTEEPSLHTPLNQPRCKRPQAAGQDRRAADPPQTCQIPELPPAPSRLVCIPANASKRSHCTPPPHACVSTAPVVTRADGTGTARHTACSTQHTRDRMHSMQSNRDPAAPLTAALKGQSGALQWTRRAQTPAAALCRPD